MIFLISTSKQHQYVSIDKVQSKSLWKLEIVFLVKLIVPWARKRQQQALGCSETANTFLFPNINHFRFNIVTEKSKSKGSESFINSSILLIILWNFSQCLIWPSRNRGPNSCVFVQVMWPLSRFFNQDNCFPGNLGGGLNGWRWPCAKIRQSEDMMHNKAPHSKKTKSESRRKQKKICISPFSWDIWSIAILRLFVNYNVLTKEESQIEDKGGDS